MGRNKAAKEEIMTEKQVCRYIELVSRKLFIMSHSGVSWKPEYREEMRLIDQELKPLLTLVQMLRKEKGGQK